MTYYVAYIRKDVDSGFGVEFPDLPGCFSAGATVEEALAMAEDALAGHLSVLIEHGDKVPAPRSIDQLLADPERGEALAVLVLADPDLHKPRACQCEPVAVTPETDRRAGNQSLTLLRRRAEISASF